MSPSISPQVDKRAAYVKGLRALADILEAHPELELPYSGSKDSPLSFIPYGSANRTQAGLFARLIPGTVAKQPRGEAVDLIGSVHGLHVCLIATRDEVCERIVVGTREVEIEEPDPVALAKVPTVKRTEVVEDVEWRCGSILAADTSRQVAEVRENAAALEEQHDEDDQARADLADVLAEAVSRG